MRKKPFRHRDSRRPIDDLGNGQWDIRRLRELLEKIIPNNNSVDDFEVEHDFPGIGFKKTFLNAHRIPGEGNRPGMILLSMEDVTGPS